MTKAEALQKIKAVKAYMTSGNPIWDVAEIGEAFDMAIEALSASKTDMKMGKWEVYVISPFDGEGCRCSECKYEGAPYWDYCPNCGAKMKEGDQK